MPFPIRIHSVMSGSADADINRHPRPSSWRDVHPCISRAVIPTVQEYPFAVEETAEAEMAPVLEEVTADHAVMIVAHNAIVLVFAVHALMLMLTVSALLSSIVVKVALAVVLAGGVFVISLPIEVVAAGFGPAALVERLPVPLAVKAAGRTFRGSGEAWSARSVKARRRS